MVHMYSDLYGRVTTMSTARVAKHFPYEDPVSVTTVPELIWVEVYHHELLPQAELSLSII